MATPTLERPESVTDPVAPPHRAASSDQVVAAQSLIVLRRTTADGRWSFLLSLVGAISLVWILDQRVLSLSGALGLWILVYVAFLIIYTVVGAAQWPLRSVFDRLVSVLLATAAIFVLAAVVGQVLFVSFRGASAIDHGNFWTQSMLLTGPLDGLDSGGMIHALIGSLEQLGLATLFSVPIGITAALYLVELNDWLTRPVRIIVEAMTALPEIIAGLFVYIVVVLTLGLERSGFAASLALTVMMIPIVTRTAEVVLRLVPGSLREASYALGASQFRTVWTVLLPTARSGLSTAVILAMARAVGETSPVLLTEGYANGVNPNPFSGPQLSLPIYIFTQVRQPQPAEIARGFGAALALMIMVLVLFVLARLIGGSAPGQVSARQRRRIERQSVADATDQRRADDQEIAQRAPTFVAPGYPDPVTP